MWIKAHYAGRGSLRSMCLTSFYFLLFPFFCALQASGGKHEASTRNAGGEWREARGEYEKCGRRVEGSTRRVRESREAGGGKHEASARKARGARHTQVDVFIHAPPFDRVSSLAFFSHLIRTFVLSRKKWNPLHELKCYNEWNFLLISLGQEPWENRSFVKT